MYKILVVDDEKWVRKGIIHKMTVNGLAFSWIEEASDGPEAMELILRRNPDIVITDIRMGKMDGIELIKNALQNNPNIKFIIISGYAEFKYAEQAINMGVAGYLLKPIEDENLMATVRKVIGELDMNKDQQEALEKSKHLEKNNYIYRIEYFINSLISLPADFDKGEYVDILTSCRLFQPGNKYVLLLLNINSSSYFMSSFEYHDIDLVKYAVKNILAEIQQGENIIVMDNPKDINQIMVIFAGKNEHGLLRLCHSFAADSYEKLVKSLNISVTLSYSYVQDSISREIYRQAREAMDLRLINSVNTIFGYEYVKVNNKLQIPEQKLKLLQNYMEFSHMKNIEVLLKDIFSEGSMAGASANSIRLNFSEVINMLIKVCTRRNLDIAGKIDSDALSGDIVNHFNNPDEIVSYLFTTCIRALKVGDCSVFDRRSLCAKVRQYIEDHFDEKITVKYLSRKFAIDAEYLSTLYKSETGCSLIKHLTSIRIQKACEMLQKTSLNTIEISKNVGYDDHLYFYRVFKKVMGLTPAEFRNDNSN